MQMKEPFSESEVKAYIEFLNYLAAHARFDFTTKDASKWIELYTHAVKIGKKMQASTFENVGPISKPEVETK